MSSSLHSSGIDILNLHFCFYLSHEFLLLALLFLFFYFCLDILLFIFLACSAERLLIFFLSSNKHLGYKFLFNNHFSCNSYILIRSIFIQFKLKIVLLFYMCFFTTLDVSTHVKGELSYCNSSPFPPLSLIWSQGR